MFPITQDQRTSQSKTVTSIFNEKHQCGSRTYKIPATEVQNNKNLLKSTKVFFLIMMMMMMMMIIIIIRAQWVWER